MIIRIAAALLLAACATGAPEDAASTSSSSLAAPTPADIATRISATSDGQNVTVKVGSKIAVELVGVPTAGYMWTPVEIPAFLAPAGEYGGPTSKAQLEPGFAGGNHWEAFAFDVSGAGEGVLRFEQRRPWEDDAEPAVSAFSVYIIAKE